KLVDDSFENDFLPLSPETLVNDSCDSYNNLKLSLPNNSDEENNKNFLSGRRIINVDYFLNSLQSIKHEPFNCSIQNLVFKSEIKKGFFSEFHFQCNLCRKKEVIFSEPPDISQSLSINAAIVTATVNTGQGFTNLEQFSSILDMPCMSNKSYQKFHQFLSKQIENTAWESIELAGKEEARLAIENGDINSNGIPMITVVADGAWSKRSYKRNYNAASGVACIVGYRTKKVLFVGVRNKYCSICQKSCTNNKDAPEHLCYKNWNGTSTAMEADIIVEGFRQSIPMHNIIYHKLIGDGDSSVLKKIMLAKPYGNNLDVKKIECANHILRNYLNRLVDIATKRKSSSGSVVPGLLRTNLKDKRLKL
ncbi:Uncharacterized protein FWK35_00036722, partial [Aphis craccivora]